MPDEYNLTGGVPESVALHGRYPGEDDGVLRQVITDDEGALIVAPANGTSFPVEIVAPLPVPVDTEDRVVLVDTEDRVVLVNETLHTTYAVERYDVPYSSGAVGVAISGKPVTTGGFMVTAPNANHESIFWGSAAGKCWIEIEPGSSKTFAYPTPNGFYWYSPYDFSGATPPEDIQDKLIIEYYD